MAGLWQLIAKEATTNLITNPSFEVGTTGWAATGGASIARSTDDPVSGQYNLKVTPSAATTDGVSGQICSATDGVTYTFSIYLAGVSGREYNICIANAGVTNISTISMIAADGEWHRYEVTYAAEATETLYCYIYKNTHANTDPFYIDAAQCEAKAYSTTYCDGSIDPPKGFTSSGCSWAGTAHASTSSRLATSRAGGRVKNLDDYYFYVTNPTGIGAPPVTNHFTEYALLPGALHEHTKINSRLFILNGLIVGTTLATLHSRRSTLYAALAPQNNEDPVLLRYTGGTTTLEISAYYDGGMEAGVREGFNERLGIRFYCPDPNWREVIE